ncbi:MAG: FG-GAP-like repeat-containing protein [Rivularia sp. (in: cyanobacteria)]
MASKDIFGNGNPEELFDSSLLDSSQEDTYGLNPGNKVNNPGSDPLSTEIEKLSTDNNINIVYSTDNLGSETVSLVSEPFLFNQTSSQEQQLQQATDFNKIDIDLNKNNIDSLTGNNENNPLVGNPELKFLTDKSDDNSTSPTPQSAIPQAPGDITELKFVQDKSKLKVFENGDLVEEVQAKQNQPIPFTIERVQIAALNSNDLPSVENDRTYHDNGQGIGITDGNDGNNRSVKNKIDGDEIFQIKIQPTDNYNSAFSATVGVDQVGAIANKSDGGKVKIVAMRGATVVGEEIFNINNKKEQLTFSSDTAFDRLHLMAGDDNTKFTFRSTEFQAVVTPSPLITYLEFAPDELGISLTENGSVVEQFSVGENQPVPSNSSRLEVTAVDSQDDGSVLDTTNYLSAEGIGIIDGDDNTEILQKRIDGDEILEFKINSTDNYNSALSATVALDKIKSVRANNGTLKDGGAVKILALRDDILVGGTSYNINSETEEIFFLSNQPFDRLQIQAGNEATQFTLRSVELESVTTSPSPTASLKFVQDRLRLNVFENEVLSKQVRGGQNQAIPDAFERIEVRAVDSDDGGTVKIDSTFIDTGEGIGIADGQDGNSSLKKKIDGDEILEFKIKPTQNYETANQALINVDRVSAIDSNKNGGTVKVVAVREGNTVSEQTYTIANKNQKLSFTSDNAFDTLQLQAGDDNTKFSFRYIEFAVLTNVAPTDTEAPLISAALANDTAPNDTINNDGVTFDATIAGTVTDTSQVVEFVAGFNDTPITDYVNVLPQLNEDGSFTLNQATLEQIYGDVLPQGSHTLNLQAVDASGNQSDVFDIAFTLDNDTAAPTLSLLSTSDSGGSNTDNITNNTVPIITGSAEAGSVVQLFQNGEQEQDNQLIGETTADDTGNWQIATNNLADGTYNFSAIATDIAGNTNNSATPLQLTVDTTQPTINFTTSIDTEPLTEGSRLAGNLDGTGSDISTISYRFNNGAEIAIMIDAAGAFDEELDLTGVSDGDYTLTVTITDIAGNVSTIPYNITVGADTSTAEVTAGLVNDTAPDNITNSDGITSDATIAGSIDNFGDSVRLRAGFGDTPALDYVDITDSVNSGGNFNLDLSQLSNINRASLEDGAYSLNLLLEDLQGNELSNSEVNFTLDTSNPVLELKTPVDSGEHSSKSRLIGSVSDTGSGLFDTSYSLDGQASSPLTVSNQGAFDQTLVPTGLTNGDHSLTLSVFDIAGNSTQTSANFTVSDDFIIGSTDTVGWGIKTADGVILGEQNSFVTQTAMEIDLGQDEGKRQLEFEIDAQFDTSDTNTASEDRLSLYLVDSFTPEVTLLDQGEPGTALFSLSGTDAEFTPGLVNYDGNRVRVDLTSLEGQTSGSLVFQLINNDSDNGSVVEIKDITNTVDTEAISGPVFPTDIERADIGEQINLGDFDTTTDVELLLSNVRLDSDTGTYTADLQVRNNGTTTLGRELAVVLTNLPDGVSLNSVSGTDSENSPYINLSNAIRPGGLNPQAISDAVQIVFDNPSLTRFDLQPVFYAGALEQPPQLSPIESQSVMPGERLEIPLIATDPNGDPISYSLRSDTPLPKGELTGDGTLIFTPAPDDIGTYSFTVVATAGEVDVTQDVTITVEPDPITTTRVSGVIENTDQEALAGVVIELGGLQTTTDANGYFQLEVDGELPSDTLKVRAELLAGDDAYPFIAEKLPLVLEHEVYEGVNNIINRPIYLPVLDTENGVNVDPNANTTVTTDTIPGASVFVAAGSLKDQEGNPFTGTLSITEVPADLTPASLPENLRPDLVVTIQPGEMVFTTPAPLSLPNRAGYAPGLEMDLWSINPNTGLFDKVGVGKVSDDGSVIETISGGIRNSSWHFVTPPPGAFGNLNDPEDDPRNKDKECDYCEATQPINSEVELHSGTVQENYDLITYQSLSETRGLRLNYDSMRADPRPIVHFGYDNVGLISTDSGRLVAKLKVKQGDFTYQVTGTIPGKNGLSNGEHVWKIPAEGGDADAALQMDMRSLSSGKYEYELTTGLQAFTGTEFNGSSTTSTDDLINVNSVDSVFGSGWGLAGLQEIVENEDGSVLLIDGDGSQFLFEAPAQAGGSYVSPSFDFSTLERVNGTFRRTMKDGTVYQFSAQNKLELVRNTNGNETQYKYNTGGKLSKIIDPVGLETTFTYTSGRVSSITDPGNRVTELKYDTKGNLIEITDPDESSHKWEYDKSHRMTATIDKRSNRGEDIYDAYGRVKTAIRPDGTKVKVNPIQTQGLNRSGKTLDPFNAPVAKGLGDADASFADGNGNVTRTKLDQAGQAISSIDGAGLLPSVERNDNNLVTKSTSARGHVTDYTYDDKGNVLSIKEEIPIPFQGTDNNASNDLFPNRIYKTGEGPKQIVTADLNGDGFVDLVSANYYDDRTDISTLFGNGDGSFAGATTFDIAEDRPSSVAVGDMNGDGFLDIVSVNNYYNTISMLLGDGEGSFTATTDIDVGYESSFLVLGDLDNDADLDIVIASGGGYNEEPSLSIMSNNGNATFAETTNYVIEEGPEKVALGDVDGDGSLDIVTANNDFYFSYGLSVLLNDSNGAFSQAANYTEEAFDFEIYDVALGDVNGDGRQDIVTANSYYSDGRVSVLLNEGDGTFADSTDYTVDTSPDSLTLGDVNGDGRLDIVTANYYYYENGLSVLLQNEDGTFSDNTNYTTGGDVRSVVLGDADGDGFLDLLAANYDNDSVSVLLNKGDGTFKTETETETTEYDSEFTSKSVIVGDINQDSIPDTLILSYENTVAARLGNGDGTFTPEINSTIGTSNTFLEQVALGDVNGDGLPDLVAVSNNFDGITENLSVLLGNGNGTFDSESKYAVGDRPLSVALGDVNGDGRQDIVTANYYGNSISVLLGNSDGSFTAQTEYASGEQPTSVALGDINGDGRQDIVTGNRYSSSVSVLLGNGDGTFAEKTDYATESIVASLALGDVNGDGSPDIVTATDDDYSPGVSVLLGNGDGTFATKTDYTFGDKPKSVALGDVNGDGRQDIVTANYSSSSDSPSTVSVLLGNSDGSFDSKKRLDFITGREPNSIALSDFDLDGDLDFVTTNYYNDTISVGFNNSTQSVVSTGIVERRYTYDPTFNQVTSETDELGRITLYDIDPNNGNMLSTTRVVGEVGGDDDVVTSYTYTSDGQIDTMTDALGRITDHDYDDFGRLIKTTVAKDTVDEAVQQFEYDGAGNQTAFIDENNNRTEYEYDDVNRLVKTTYAKGTAEEAVEIIEYDVFGNRSVTIDANNNRIEYKYDDQNRLIKIIAADPDGSGPLTSPITTYKYDKAGNLTSVIDPLERETKYRYDARNRQIETIYADGRIEKQRYDFDDNQIGNIDSNGNQINKVYDARGRVIRSTDSLGNITRFEYDTANQLIAITDDNEHKTRYKYDDLGRRVEVIDPLEHITTTEYDKVGNVTVVTDANENTTRYTYDNRDRQTVVTDALENTSTTIYDGVGNIVSIEDPEENTTILSYDARNRLIAEENANGAIRSHTYDAVGNRTSVTDRNNRVRQFSYDALNRQIEENWLDDEDNSIRTTTLDYDAAGQLIDVSDPDSRYRFKYDVLGRRTSVDNTGTPGVPRVVLDYEYDAEGNIISVTDTINGQEKGIENFTYDALNRLTKVTQSGNGVANKRVDMTYDGIGLMTGLTRYADLTGTQLVTDTTYTYDPSNRLKNISHKRGSTILAEYSYDYDVANRITQFTSPDGTSDYSYDDTDQLTGTDHSFQTDESYSYDDNGNRTNAGYQTSTNNRLQSDGEYNYEYDNEGNRTKRTEIATGEITEYSWDYHNRLTQVITKDAGNITKQVDYIYDFNGRRIAKVVDPDGAGIATATVERFVYDGDNIALTFDGNGTQTHRYLHGAVVDQILADEDANGNTLWTLTDNVGTVRDLVDSSGTVQNHITYDSFGNVTNQTNSTINTRFGYTGREFDEETGQYYYRARYYDSGVGRFISEDPIGFAGGDTNLYRYVANRPVDNIDPYGEFKVELRYKGVGGTHVDIVVTDRDGSRSYWAAAEKQNADSYIFGLLRTSSSGFGIAGFGKIQAQSELKDYGPGFVFYVDNPADIQVVYDDGTDCPDKALEDKIWATLQSIDLVNIPYDPLRRNSNSAAFETLRRTFPNRSITPKKFVPAWDINPFTGRSKNDLRPSELPYYDRHYDNFTRHAR